MRWSIRIFNIPPPRATPCVQIPAPWGQNCVQIPTQVLDLIKKIFFVKGKISNPDQFLSTLSPKPSAFCLWKWIFYLKTPPYQKSKHIHSAGKTCQICFKLPTPVRQGSNSLPPRHGWQTKKLWVALKGGCWSFKLIGTLLGIKLLFTSGGIFVIFYTILLRSFIICNFSKCGGGGGGGMEVGSRHGAELNISSISDNFLLFS